MHCRAYFLDAVVPGASAQCITLWNVEPNRRPSLAYRLYQRRLRRELQTRPVPKHIAMILDGNRRWARQNELQSVGHGHRAGAAKMVEFLEWCDELGVEVVTLYLLSNDNLTGRAVEELTDLFQIIANLAEQLAGTEGWRIRHVGSNDNLPEILRAAMQNAVAASETKDGMQVNLAVGYGGRNEVVEAVRQILQHHEGSTKELADKLTPDMIGANLYTKGQPDPDLVIRTSGEQRLSDFMLWQSAHSEFYFMDALGPDLREVDLLRAVRDYGLRSRRFGK